MYLSVKVDSEKEFNEVERIFKILGKSWTGSEVTYDPEINYIEYGFRDEDKMTYNSGSDDFLKSNEVLSYEEYVNKFDLTKLSDDIKRAIRVDSVDESDKVQDALNSVGFEWSSGDKHFHTGAPALITINYRGDNTLTYSSLPPFDTQGKILYSVSEILQAVEVTKQLQNTGETKMTLIDLSNLPTSQVQAIKDLKDRLNGTHYPLYSFADKIRYDSKGFDDDSEELYEAINNLDDRETELQVIDFLFNKDTKFTIAKKGYVVVSRFTDEDDDHLYLSEGNQTTYSKEFAKVFVDRDEAEEAAGLFGRVEEA